jgi:hypothetical protein
MFCRQYLNLPQDMPMNVGNISIGACWVSARSISLIYISELLAVILQVTLCSMAVCGSSPVQFQLLWHRPFVALFNIGLSNFWRTGYLAILHACPRYPRLCGDLTIVQRINILMYPEIMTVHIKIFNLPPTYDCLSRFCTYLEFMIVYQGFELISRLPPIVCMYTLRF